MRIDWEDRSDDALACPQCGRVHPSARMVRLPYGAVVSSYSEDYRRYCEANTVLKRFRSKRTRMQHLAAVANRRGEQAAAELRAEMLRVWQHKEEKKR
jgi:hypothetical protein